MKTIDNKLIPVILIHDKASKKLAEAFSYFKNYKLHDASNICWNNKKVITENINMFLSSDKDLENKKILSIYGDGCFHHYTYGLCKIIADKKSENYSYLHIDRHDDYGGDKEYLTCGAFVEGIEKDTNAKCVSMIGVACPIKKIPTLNEEKCSDKNIKKFIRKIIEKTPEDIYISIDMDVLKDGIRTSYGNGKLTLCNLLEIIGTLKNRKNIIGADVLGYSNSSSNKEHHEKNIITYKEIINCFLA